MSERILGPTGSKRRKRFLLVPVLLVAAASLFLVASASGVLTGSPSKFESGNDPTLGLGNMVVNTAGNNDWKTVAFTHLTDVASSGTDDSFTPGQKQDTTCPTVTGHGNPPKDDFTDVASFSEVNATTGDTYLYGATIRYTANGNASENIELKQGTSGYCPGSTTLLARTAGDKLLAIDYLGGGKAVQFHVLTWVASGPCNVSNDVAPCWGATVVTLDGTTAEGGVNDVAITAVNNPISGTALVAGQFAEFGVNLTAAGIIGSGACTAFAQTVWESRSSGSSFVSSTKDIVLENKTISNCGEIVIIKRSNPRGVDQDFSFTSDIAGSELTCVADSTPASFTLNDKAGVDSSPPVAGGNVEDCTKVPAGTYHVTEGADPTGFAFGSLICTTGGAQDGTVPKKANITIAAGDTVTCVYTNNQQKGAIKITKTSSKGLHPGLQGATFSITGPNSYSSSVQSGADGTVCVDNLAFGTYSVQETAPPTGYAIDDSTAHDVAVSANSTCGDGSEATFAATDTPLTDLVVTATGEAAPAGTTNSQITCIDAGGGNIGDSPTANTDPATMTANGLSPGTYTCTVVIDP